jgi:hypothetical protein
VSKVMKGVGAQSRSVDIFERLDAGLIELIRPP